MADKTQICRVRRLGRVDYLDATRMQNGMIRLRREGLIPDSLLLLEHPDVITAGSASRPEQVLVSEDEREKLGVEFHETGRGGAVTYHGPGQLVCYPILQLKGAQKNARKYLRNLEEVLIRSLALYGVAAQGHDEHTGVWVGADDAPKKIGAIGVRLSNWITSHGFALNVTTDLSRFDMIVPCGIEELGVTSLAECLPRAPSMEEIENRIIEQFGIVFEREMSEQRIEG